MHRRAAYDPWHAACLACCAAGTALALLFAVVVFAHPEALALTEQRMRGECADVVDLGRVPLDPMAPHGPYHVLRQPCCLLL